MSRGMKDAMGPFARERRQKMEELHPDNMRYHPETRKIINAYMRGGWDSVDREIKKILLPSRSER
jgi:hypothetical protein